MGLKGKRILITSGPTWVPIDPVRVISNIATGETGILLAKELAARKAKVTLLQGPSCIKATILPKSVRVIKFRFFDELKKLFFRELKSKMYNAVIHSAAVSDYELENPYKTKVSSGLRKLYIKLKPAPKMINMIKKIEPSAKVCAFKFETNVTRPGLLKKARALMVRSRAELTVANTLHGEKYEAYILKKDKIIGPLCAKKTLSLKLTEEMERLL